MSRRRHQTKLSKAQSYIHRIATIEYDMDGMIKAYGLPFVIEFAKAVASGKIDCRQCVDRWASHTSMYGSNAMSASVWFETHHDEFLLTSDEAQALFDETA